MSIIPENELNQGLNQAQATNLSNGHHDSHPVASLRGQTPSPDVITLDAALKYAELGYPVFPCKPADKKPYWNESDLRHGWKSASTDEDQIIAWWERWPNAMIGASMAGVVVMDDDTERKNLPAWPPEPEQRLALAGAPKSRTRSGGYHYFFRRPDNVKWHINLKPAKGIDIRTDGGYVILPPSIYEDGTEYAWASNELDCTPEKLPDPPQWLFESLEATNQPARQNASQSPEDGPGNGVYLPADLDVEQTYRLASQVVTTLWLHWETQGIFQCGNQSTIQERLHRPALMTLAQAMFTTRLHHQRWPEFEHRIHEDLDRAGCPSLGSQIPVKDVIQARNPTWYSLASLLRGVGANEMEIMETILAVNGTQCFEEKPTPAKEIDRIARHACGPNKSGLEGWIASICSSAGIHWESPVPVIQLPPNVEVVETEEELPTNDPGRLPDNFVDEAPGFIQCVKEYVLATSRYEQPLFAMLSGVALQAACVGSKIYEENLNSTMLYLVGLTKSGSGKDRPHEAISEILMESRGFNVECQGLLGAGDLTSHYALTRALQDLQDASLPASMILPIDEFGDFLKRCHSGNIEWRRMTSLLKKMYSRGWTHIDCKYVDKSKTVDITKPNLILYGVSTADAFFKSLNHDSITGGFCNRLLVFEGEEMPERKRGRRRSRPEVPEVIKNRIAFWHQYKHSAHVCPVPGQSGPYATPEIINTTDEAYDLWEEHTDRIDQERGHQRQEVICELLSRIVQNAMRLAVVHVCARVDPDQFRAPVVDVEAVNWAMGIAEHAARYLIFKLEENLGENQFEENVKLTRKLIRKKQGAGADHSWLIKRKPHCYLNPRERKEVLDTLEEREEIVKAYVPGKTKPTQKYWAVGHVPQVVLDQLTTVNNSNNSK